MSVKKHAIALFILVFLLGAFAQKGKAQQDSLLALVKTMPDNEGKAKVYKDIAFSYYFSDPDKCIAYCDTLYELSKKVGYKKGLSSHLYIRSIAYYIKEDYEKAIEYCEASVAETRKQKDHSNELIYLDFLGSIYREIGLYEKALDYQLASLKLAESINDTIGMAYAHSNLSTIFHDLKDNATIKKHLDEAIKLAENTEEYALLANSYSTYGVVLDDPKDKLLMFQKALEYSNMTGTTYHARTIHINLGEYYIKQGDLNKAIEQARKAFEISNEYEDNFSLAESATALGDFFTQKNQLDSAEYYLEQAISASNKIGYNLKLKDAYYYLAALYRKKNAPNQALTFMDSAYVLKDTIYNEELTQQIQTNAAKYEFEKNQRVISQQQLAIAQATNNRNRLIFLGLLLLAAVASVYQWYLSRQQKQKQEAKLAFTQQQAEADRLRELDQLKTNFFTNISHELRTPLTLILSPLADLQEKAKAVPVRDKLQIIKNNANRLLGLVNEIMDLAKVEAGKLELQRSKLALEDFVRRIFFSFESLAELRRIRFDLAIDLKETMVRADREKMEKILHNLLSNAIKYTGAGGQVTMRVRQEQDAYIFEVSDTGQGISVEDLPRIFDRFYQAQQGSLQGGTGVGLALSKELAELMQGSLSAKSEVGKGSVFTLRVPLEAIQMDAAKTHETEVPSQAAIFAEAENTTHAVFAPIAIAGEKPRLLVVEDNPDLGKYLVQVLSEHYQCVLATDGEEALKQLKTHRFDCITSDVMMPNMDGFELREAINQNQEWRQIPFLLLTARNLEDDKIRGFQLGIDDYVTKPFSTRELQARIHNLISNKLERDNFAKAEEAEVTAEKLPVLTEAQKLLKQAEAAILERLDDQQFGVEDLAKAVNYSSRQLSRLLKKHTGLSSVNFILEVRLQKARELLEKRLCASVIEAQYEVGISSTSYFTRKFTERFGKNPSALL